MKKIFISCALTLLGICTSMKAQVSDVNVIVSPMAQYTWWDKDLSLGNIPFWGVRAGFGFGPIIEFRALYEQSYNLKADLNRINWKPAQNWADKLDHTNAEIKRYGGEIKVNVWNAFRLTPYITAGAGVMDFKYNEATPGGNESYKESQLYGSLGAGLKINMSKRVVLSLEGKNTLFNLNKNNRYTNPNVNSDKVLQNWSAGASLDFYLGGNDYSNETEIGKAYRNMFSNGFRGVTFVVDPGITYIDFNDKSNFKDQYFIGASAGVDFSPLVGIRGFYYHATEMPNKLNFKFNKDMKIYGGNLVTKLNFARGIVPYLTVGGGYLNAKSQPDNTKDIKSGYFAFAGAGIEIPLFKYFALYGNVNGMVNQQDNPDISNITAPSDVNFNIMYQAGLKFNFGLSNKDAQKIYEKDIENRLASQKELNNKELNELRANKEKLIQSYEDKLASQKELSDKELNELKAEKEKVIKIYEDKLSELNDKLAKAALRNDKDEVEKLIDRKKEIETSLIQTKQENESLGDINKTIKITPSQFEILVNRVVEKIEYNNAKEGNNKKQADNNLSDLDKILLINALQKSQTCAMPITEVQAKQAPSDDKTNALLEKMDKVLDKMDQSYDSMVKMNALQNQRVNHAVQVANEVSQHAIRDSYRDSAPVEDKVIIVNPDSKSKIVETAVVAPQNTIQAVTPYNKFWFEGLGVLGGCSISDGFRGQFGARAYKPINASNFEFVPDINISFGKSIEFGVSANLVYNINFDKIPVVVPYVGLGFGYFSANKTRFASNVMVGTYFKDILNGGLFAEYSVHGLFRENMISVGYRFLF